MPRVLKAFRKRPPVHCLLDYEPGGKQGVWPTLCGIASSKDLYDDGKTLIGRWSHLSAMKRHYLSGNRFIYITCPTCRRKLQCQDS